MTQDEFPNRREPSLSGEHAPHSTNNEPSLSLDRILPGLREALDSSDRGKRLTTIEQLRSSSAVTVVPLLIELLETSTDSKTRQRCAATLGQIGDERAVGVLIKLLNEIDVSVRKVAVWALGEIGSPEVVTPLLNLVERETDTRILANAIASLGQLGDLNVLPILLRFTEDTGENSLASTAYAAIKTLARSCQLTQLIEFLYHESPTMRHWAADRFVHHREVPTIGYLPLLEKLLSYEERSDVAQRAVHLISQIDVPQARQTMLDLLEDADARLRNAAIRGVRLRPFDAALPILLARYEGETDQNRGEIVDAVAEFDDPCVLPFLLEAMENEDYQWRAIWALQSLNVPGIELILLERANKTEREGRLRLIHKLNYFPASEVNSFLLGLIENQDEKERQVAVSSLHPELFPEAIQPLISVIYHDTSIDVRKSAIWTLCEAFDEYIEAILRAFVSETDNDEIRAVALSALIGRGVVDARELLLEHLERIRDEDALAYIIDQLRILHPDAEMEIMRRLYRTAQSALLRAEIIDEMAHLLTADGIQLVIEALTNDPDPSVRSTAVYTLSYVAWDNETLVARLIDALEDTGLVEGRFSTESWRVCDSAADCLERMTHQPAAQEALAKWKSHHW